MENISKTGTTYKGDMMNSLISTVKKIETRSLAAEFLEDLKRHQELLRAGKIEDLGEEMRRGR